MTCFSKRLLSVLLALTMLWTLSATAPIAAAEEEGPDAYQMEVIVRVDGIPISRLQLLNALNKLLPTSSYHASVPEDRYEKAQKSALDTLILTALVYKEAQEMKLDKVDPALIDADIKKIKERLPEGDTLEDVLKRSDMTMADLREDLKEGIVLQQVRKNRRAEFKKLSEETVTDTYMKEYYNNNLNKFNMPGKLKIRRILIKVDPSGGQRLWNKVQKNAVALVKKARGGEDFAEMAKENSEGPEAEDGGNVGWVHIGSLSQEVDFALSTMNKGDVSDPIMTIYGYHIIKLEDTTPSILMAFSEINKDGLKKELIEQEYKRLGNEWADGLRANAKIEYLKDLY